MGKTVFVDSTYRNRNLNESQSQFVLNYNRTDLDVILDAKSRQVAFDNKGDTYPPIGTTVTNASPTLGEVIVDLLGSTPDTERFYRNMIIEIAEPDGTLGSKIPLVSSIESRSINDYQELVDPAGPTTFQRVFLSMPLTTTYTTSAVWTFREETPRIRNTFVVAATLNPSASTVLINSSDIKTGILGMGIRIMAPKLYTALGTDYVTTEEINMTRMIVNVEDLGTEAILTLDSPLAANIGGVVTDTYVYEILKTTEAFNPFFYSGSMCQQEEINYVVRLATLTIPNKTLTNSGGGTIINHPYLYVKLSNSRMPTYNILNSNNPNAKTALFKVPIDDDAISNTAVKFFQFTHCQMKQLVNSKIFAEFSFSVFLPNGEVLAFVENEKFQPFPPNSDVQISAKFSFKEVY